MSADLDPSRRGQRRSTASLYEPFDAVVVRAPLLPVEAYQDPPPLTDALVRSALAVSSPDLLAQLDRDGSRDVRGGRGSRSLLRYLIRMSTRPTPFGMFAGVGLARLDRTTKLAIGTDPVRTRTRPDMEWLLALVATLESRPEIRRELSFHTNPCAWLHQGRVLLPERVPLEPGGDAGAVDIRATAVVRRILKMCRAPTPWIEIAAAALETPGASVEKVDQLLSELCRQEFLLSELRPPLTNPAPARHVEHVLAGLPAAAADHLALSNLLDAMDAWDRSDLTGREEALHAITGSAKLLVPSARGVVIQVDTALPMSGARLAKSVGLAAARAAELLLRISPAFGPDSLGGFRQAFVERYGVDREVPLLELLDPHRGLGPPPPVSAQSNLNPSRLAIRHATLRRLAAETLRDHGLVVELDDDTVERLATNDPTAATAPFSLDVSVFVLAESSAAIDAGDFRLLAGPNLGAQAAGRNLGRFADLLDAGGVLGDMAAVEQDRTPAVHAELVYLPSQGRSANVAIRPSTYPYEVVFGTTPGVAAEDAIPVSELLVGVHGNRFRVRWPGAPGELLVHQGHMLTTMLAPSAARFLEDVTRGERLPFSAFHWGPVGDLPFLPRVERERLILSPAQWRIDAEVRDRLHADGEAFHSRFAAWRRDWMVPRRVYLTIADNRLLLDLDAPAHVEVLRGELRRLRDEATLVLQEPLPAPEHAWLIGPAGHHLAEFVVSLVQRKGGGPNGSVVATASDRVAAVATSDRLRPPGSDWLYVKLYGPPDRQDDLLTGPVRELGQFATGSGLADRWFFVRYADPDPHLRLRFQGDPRRLLAELLPRVTEWAQNLISQGGGSRLIVDTYEREVERYGGVAGIAAAEALFAVDSLFVVELLQRAETKRVPLDRTTLAVLSVDDLLEALGLDVDSRISLYRDAVHTRREAGSDYRTRQRELRRILTPSINPDAGMIADVLRARRATLAPIGAHLRLLEDRRELTKSLRAVLSSVVHMHCNLLLASGAPTEQRVLGLLLRTREGLQRSNAQAADGT
jgi:lantibiotic biosynthesis protein